LILISALKLKLIIGIVNFDDVDLTTERIENVQRPQRRRENDGQDVMVGLQDDDMQAEASRQVVLSKAWRFDRGN